MTYRVKEPPTEYVAAYNFVSFSGGSDEIRQKAISLTHAAAADDIRATSSIDVSEWQIEGRLQEPFYLSGDPVEKQRLAEQILVNASSRTGGFRSYFANFYGTTLYVELGTYSGERIPRGRVIPATKFVDDGSSRQVSLAARTVLDLIVTCLPRAYRDRYAAELSGEMTSLKKRQQLSYAVSIAVALPRIRRELSGSPRPRDTHS